MDNILRWPPAWATWTGLVQEKLRWQQTFVATQGDSSFQPHTLTDITFTFQEFICRHTRWKAFASCSNSLSLFRILLDGDLLSSSLLSPFRKSSDTNSSSLSFFFMNSLDGNFLSSSSLLLFRISLDDNVIHFHFSGIHLKAMGLECFIPHFHFSL